MKKPVIIIALLICYGLFALAQVHRQKNHPITVDSNMVCFAFVSTNVHYNSQDVMPTCVPYQYVENVLTIKSKGQVPLNPMLIGVKLKTKIEDVIYNQVPSFSKFYQSFNIYDNSDAGVTAMGINKNNINDYRYHVVMNDSVELVPWSLPTLKNVWGSKHKYAFFGTFHTPGKQLLIEVVNVKDYNVRGGVILNWGYRQNPVISGITVDIAFNQVKLRPGSNNAFAKHFEKGTNVPTDMALPIGQSGDLHINLVQHEQVPYVVRLKKNFGGKITDTQLQWWQLTDNFDVPVKEIDRSGKYDLIISAIAGSNKTANLLDVPFTIYNPPVTKKPVTLKQALPYLIGAILLIALFFVLYYRSNKIKLLKADRQRQTAGLKLRSIRAQLNPHFMFNALASIQNLINKNDISGANRYLSIFAGITRRVLDTGNEELLSLDDELKILDDYLQIEKLRFGFTYQIVANKAINTENTEIPAMLLQPFVENAVKHGISGLGINGRILIEVEKENSDLLFYIKDNGKGFTKETLLTGQISYGLKLSEERIALLNEIYKGQLFSLQIDALLTGTTVMIRLAQWL